MVNQISFCSIYNPAHYILIILLVRLIHVHVWFYRYWFNLHRLWPRLQVITTFYYITYDRVSGNGNYSFLDWIINKVRSRLLGVFTGYHETVSSFMYFTHFFFTLKCLPIKLTLRDNTAFPTKNMHFYLKCRILLESSDSNNRTLLACVCNNNCRLAPKDERLWIILDNVLLAFLLLLFLYFFIHFDRKAISDKDLIVLPIKSTHSLKEKLTVYSYTKTVLHFLNKSILPAEDVRAHLNNISEKRCISFK